MRPVSLLPFLAALGACEGSHGLAAGGCLPSRVPAQVVPAQVVLVQEAGLYGLREGKTLVLAPHPRNPVNDGFQGMQVLTGRFAHPAGAERTAAARAAGRCQSIQRR